ncbi:Gti1/Pac2 family transcription factor [Nematocida sp. LUAm3]|nr:Gti1/Pac2 family transcription factor [Nematocida sp. LUAm3]KAI5175317.1 Gti1/Pac2 family transcription factor [Nematocida sp. LUAm2]KAI5177726.1 Gti1/Pac2 family transcription factor [Nematocida sp. LUAm1]
MDKHDASKNYNISLHNQAEGRESIYGTLRTEEEALKIIDMCRIDMLPRVTSRLTEAERDKIRPGGIYVYEEEESEIARWTDRKLWSSSKIFGRYLIYYELETIEIPKIQETEFITKLNPIEAILKRGREAILQEEELGAGKREAKRKENGLIKLTASLPHQGQNYHMIAYTSIDFMKNVHRCDIWRVVEAWQVPWGFKLRMDYRKKKVPYIELDASFFIKKEASRLRTRETKDPRRTKSFPAPKPRTSFLSHGCLDNIFPRLYEEEYKDINEMKESASLQEFFYENEYWENEYNV